ncbi:hypothetical protein I858_004520 [Planococcus versutus]|uniref:Uncharacterized protein n=1 Tax=Planococcus versutus TaxID=1302659 RepID=A0A1B1RZD8_9BACL|nr:hypothetical protein I858_004520 [Planococcus versutus]
MELLVQPSKRFGMLKSVGHHVLHFMLVPSVFFLFSSALLGSICQEILRNKIKLGEIKRLLKKAAVN